MVELIKNNDLLIIEKIKKVKFLTFKSREIQDQLTVMHRMKFIHIYNSFNSFFWKEKVRSREVMLLT